VVEWSDAIELNFGALFIGVACCLEIGRDILKESSYGEMNRFILKCFQLIV
jgi:hypothetical protein